MISCNGLRLLLVGTYPPPYGGIASHMTNLLPGLKSRGAEDIAVVSFHEKDAVEEHDGFTVYRFNLRNQMKRLANPASWPVALATARALVDRRLDGKAIVQECLKAVIVDEVARLRRSNVVSFYHSHSSIELLALGRRWGTKRPTVLTVFGEVYGSPKFMSDHRDLWRDMFELPHAIAASSKHCAQSFATLGVTRPIEAVYYGVDLDADRSEPLRATFRAEKGIAADDVAVLFMGRFLKEMGLDVLLDATPMLLERNPGLKLVIAGAKGDMSATAAEVAARFPGRMHIMQDVPFKEMQKVYSGVDMLVAPSFEQRACMGMAIKEAMAARLPVIGGAGGGVGEAIVEGETGHLVPLDASGRVDMQIFADAVLRLAGDAERRRRFGEAGRKRAEDLFAYERTNERMAEIFMSALRSAR